MVGTFSRDESKLEDFSIVMSQRDVCLRERGCSDIETNERAG